MDTSTLRVESQKLDLWGKGCKILDMIYERSLGVAIGSGGVYAACALGVLQRLEEQKIKIDILGGTSAGALIAALYYLDGNSVVVQQKLENIKIPSLRKAVSGSSIYKMIAGILTNRNWEDGKFGTLCIGAMYRDTKEPVTLTKDSGLSLIDCVLASLSFKLIEPTVKLNGRYVVHGGDPDYIDGMRKFGTKTIIEISPNVRIGILGKLAILINGLNGGIFAPPKDMYVDYAIHPNFSLFPLIFPLSINSQNIRFMIDQGKKLFDTSILRV